VLQSGVVPCPLFLFLRSYYSFTFFFGKLARRRGLRFGGLLGWGGLRLKWGVLVPRFGALSYEARP
jgi:hypothetical protein